MTNEAKLILQWAEQYRNCAVNHIPRNVALELPMYDPNRRAVKQGGSRYNLRFTAGDVSGARYIPYDASWQYPPLDAFADYGTVLAESEAFDDIGSTISLSEVL